jgi:hypothetical protein
VVTAPGPSVAVNYWWLPAQWRSTLAEEQRMKAALLERLGGGAGAAGTAAGTAAGDDNSNANAASEGGEL